MADWISVDAVLLVDGERVTVSAEANTDDTWTVDEMDFENDLRSDDANQRRHDAVATMVEEALSDMSKKWG